MPLVACPPKNSGVSKQTPFSHPQPPACEKGGGGGNSHFDATPLCTGTAGFVVVAAAAPFTSMQTLYPIQSVSHALPTAGFHA